MRATLRPAIAMLDESVIGARPGLAYADVYPEGGNPDDLFPSSRRGPTRVGDATEPARPRYELVVTTDGVTRVEPFKDLAGLLSREHELLQAWRATGWRETETPPPADSVPVPVRCAEEDWLGARR